jgi:hypothetical protein
MPTTHGGGNAHNQIHTVITSQFAPAIYNMTVVLAEGSVSFVALFHTIIVKKATPHVA